MRRALRAMRASLGTTPKSYCARRLSGRAASLSAQHLRTTGMEAAVCLQQAGCRGLQGCACWGTPQRCRCRRSPCLARRPERQPHGRHWRPSRLPARPARPALPCRHGNTLACRACAYAIYGAACQHLMLAAALRARRLARPLGLCIRHTGRREGRAGRAGLQQAARCVWRRPAGRPAAGGQQRHGRGCEARCHGITTRCSGQRGLRRHAQRCDLPHTSRFQISMENSLHVSR
jgi:hypothetical protein